MNNLKASNLQQSGEIRKAALQQTACLQMTLEQCLKLSTGEF